MYKGICVMITPISYYTNNYQSNYNPNFTGIGIHKIPPFKNYINKTFDRFAEISKIRWHAIDKSLEPNLKEVRKNFGDHIFHAMDINPYNEKKYVIFYHGIGQNVTSNQALYKKIVDKGYGILACEYGSFGNNTEKLTQKSIQNTAKMALEHLKSQNINEIGVVGYSAGGFPALETAVAADKNCKFLVLISPINSLKDEFNNVTKGHMIRLPKALKFVLKKIPFLFNSLENVLNAKTSIKKNNAPTYMIYSLKDNVVPPSSTENLSKQVNNLKGIIKLKEGGHSIDDDKLDAFSKLPL